jgi:sugar lactone lactonase YvrE
VLERIHLERFCFATMLGGPDRRTLFMLVADWRGPDKVDEVVAARTGQVLVAEAPARGVGWP